MSSQQKDPEKEPLNTEWARFFDAMDEVFFSFNPATKSLIQISQGCQKLYGYAVNELTSDNRLWFKMIHDEDKHIALAEPEKLQRGEQVNSQYRIFRKDGGMLWVEKKLIPSFDGAGKLTRVDGVTRDITARKAVEEKHRESETFYRQIVETAQEGIWTIDANNKTSFVNKTIGDILGYSPEEMMGKELYDFMDEEGKAYAIACMERRRNGAKEKLDIRYVTKTGKHVWTNISANPIFDDKGAYKGALAMVTDITQRRIDEDALKTSEANLRTIFENTASAYVLFNDELRIVSFNAMAQQYSEEQNNKSLKINEDIKNYFAPERWGFILELIEKVKREGSYTYEITYTSTNGEVKWHSVRWVMVKNNEGKHSGYILSNKDITRTKLAALEREKITTDLIRHNKDLEQFTYIVSHNLRSPVANIIGLTNILNDIDDDAEVRQEIIEKISASVNSVEHVIRDLNQILQVRKPGTELKEDVDFRAICEDIKAGIFTIMHKENIQLDCDFTQGASMYTIRSYIYSIFYNLVLNSIKYRRKDVESHILIKTIKLGDKIEIRVKDNGKGIDLIKNRDHLFGLYKRFDTTVEGKGMGLFMVKTQVETLGGTIRVESEPGVGTEFIIQF
ncbi:PAS domain-containing sensor histidine kinase [Mucilaginibacter sp. HMF5004]|uniref:PAS domain-containing sensor histidine kinase n=1 Tax=Mucilaginibacter rivuli TaxID=2857527 RepID=UPI001C5ED983|nr:PAS domain-containing sensor histidine kinase [Mucilaginibacter rivuli]MBW4888554.1 PAS domain-containing sensor histidine kinase [Mucilaginibacter rivuli]